MRKLFLSSVVVALICASAILAQPPLLPRDLPGDPGGSGTVGVKDYRGGLGSLDDLATVSRLVEQIKSGDLVPHVKASAQYAITDLADWPWHRPSDPFVAGDPFPFPSDTPADDDDFISIAKGTLMVPVTGTYTIQVRSDEGMGLRVIGTPFISVHGGGRLDTDGSMIHPETTIDADTRGVIQLEAGRHEFEFLMWERSGGAYWEITSARGNHPRANTARWLALGDESAIDPMGGAPRVATLVGNAQVVNVLNNDEQPADDIDIARDLIRDAREHGEGIIRDDVATIVMEDHDGISHHRPGSWVSGQGVAFRWPLNDPSSGGDVDRDFDYFSSGLFGQLQVDDGDDVADETLLLTFAMFSSDGSQFHILGQSFTEAIAEHFLFHDIDGDTTLTFPDWTSIAEALGLIELQEGVVYDWEGFHYEIDRDAGYEIWVALGNQLHLAEVGPEQFLATFTPLSNTLQTVSVPGNQGLALVEPPARLAGDYTNNRELDTDDLDMQASEIAGQNHNPQYDLNDDGLVDYVDRLIWVEELKNTFIGDANLDGEFNSSDFVQVFVAGKYERPQSAKWSEGDWNADRVFDSSDFVAAFAGGGYELGRREDGHTAVPEPSGAMLVLLGFLAGSFFHRGDAEGRS